MHTVNVWYYDDIFQTLSECTQSHSVYTVGLYYTYSNLLFCKKLICFYLFQIYIAYSHTNAFSYIGVFHLQFHLHMRL